MFIVEIICGILAIIALGTFCVKEIKDILHIIINHETPFDQNEDDK